MPTSSTGMGQFTTLFSLGEAELTTAYTGNQTAFNTHGSETAVVYINYQAGAETSLQVQVEVWDAVTGWWVVPYNDGTNAITSELSMNADLTKRWGIRRLGRFETQLRVSTKIIGTAHSVTSVVIQVQLGASRFPIAGNTV